MSKEKSRQRKVSGLFVPELSDTAKEYTSCHKQKHILQFR